MMNLFSSFNPISTSYLSLNWLMMSIPLLFITPPFWALKSKTILTNSMVTKTLITQYKASLTKATTPDLILIMVTTLAIMLYNMMSLLPNTFSTTSHIMINMTMAAPMWLASIKKKSSNMSKTLAHLTPPNTPSLLVPFMTIIELVSLLIQPITLAVRLTANITAGHIMMVLISQMYHISTMPALIMNLLMMILELGVSIIQAYVFSTLIIMYNKF